MAGDREKVRSSKAKSYHSNSEHVLADMRRMGRENARLRSSCCEEKDTSNASLCTIIDHISQVRRGLQHA
jgi:hypothetical protein